MNCSTQVTKARPGVQERLSEWTEQFGGSIPAWMAAGWCSAISIRMQVCLQGLLLLFIPSQILLQYPPVASVVVVSFSQLVILTFVRVQEDEQRLIHNEDQTKALEALHRQLTQTRDQLQQFLVIKQHRALEYKKPKICWFLPSRRDKILRSVGIFCALL